MTGTNLSQLFSNMLEEIATESGYVNLCLAFVSQYPNS